MRQSGPKPEASSEPAQEEHQDLHRGRSTQRIVMKPGFVGVWKTIETVRKIYLTVS
jgi:uncharacterized cupin superfamily protein